MREVRRATRETQRPVGPDAAPMRIVPASDSIGRWLDALAMMRGIPKGDFASLRVELEDHLRERVRELMVSGMTELEASTVAVREAGDAASFARSYTQTVHAPRRRLYMATAGLVFIAAAGLTIGGLTLNGQGGDGSFSTRERAVMPVAMDQAADDTFRDVTVTMDFEGELREAFSFIAAACGKKIDPYSSGLDSDQLNRTIQLQVEDAPVSAVLRAINAQVESDGFQVDARVHGGVMEFAPPEKFDERERVLVAYKIAERLRNPDIELDAICMAIRTFVEPDQWVDNGGEISRIIIVDDVMFVQAPPRVQTQAEWIIDQFLDETQHGAAGSHGLDDNLGEAGLVLDVVPRVIESRGWDVQINRGHGEHTGGAGGR